MEIKNFDGDIFNSNADVIAHQVNALGGFGSGIAKTIKEKFPRVCEQYKKAIAEGSLKLGMCQVVRTNPNNEDNRLIANLCGQYSFGREEKRYTNYEAIYNALDKLSQYCVSNNIKSVAFPYKMSCGLAKADWNVILAMIESNFKNTEIIVEIWKLI